MLKTITIVDIIDILLVAGIMYGAFRILRKSGATNLFWGMLAFVFVWLLVSYTLHLELTGAILDQIINVGAIALIVIFQGEIRQFFYRLGARVNDKRKSLFHTHTSAQRESLSKAVDQLVVACRHMSAQKTGALIILTGQQDLSKYADTGEKVDAAISARIIEQIFFKNTPLHDGAMLVNSGRIESAACILPVSQNQTLPKHYGLRHRAALGLTEKSDAMAIVVSEETGTISVARGEEMHSVQTEELMNNILKFYQI